MNNMITRIFCDTVCAAFPASDICFAKLRYYGSNTELYCTRREKYNAALVHQPHERENNIVTIRDGILEKPHARKWK